MGSLVSLLARCLLEWRCFCYGNMPTQTTTLPQRMDYLFIPWPLKSKKKFRKADTNRPFWCWLFWCCFILLFSVAIDHFTFWPFYVLAILCFGHFTFWPFYVLTIFCFYRFTFWPFYVLIILHFDHFTFWPFLPFGHFDHFDLAQLRSTLLSSGWPSQAQVDLAHLRLSDVFK